MLLRKKAHYVNQEGPPAVSATLAAAQEQLQRRRREHRQQRVARQPAVEPAPGRQRDPSPRQQGQETSTVPALTAEGALYQGWGSENLARSLRAARERRQAILAQEQAMSLDWLPHPPQRKGPAVSFSPSPTPQADERDHVTLYPDVALGMLRNDLSAAGRIWILLRHLDTEGCGWISVSAAQAALTGKGSSLRVCGWRQLRNLLAQGDGIFWYREKRVSEERRIWLRSLVKVAASLGVHHLQVRPVMLPVGVLLEGVGTVRAHFYASYHSGRKSANPIARQTLSDLANVSRRTQQAYEKRTGVERSANWAIGEEFSKQEAQNRAWRQGRALFTFKDRQGKTGAPDKTYLAWQLPNSYVGPHKPHAIARRKRINRNLVDLFKKGITGNGRKMVEGRQETLANSEENAVARYYERGTTAAKAYNRSAQDDIYWKSPVTVGHRRVWHVLPGHLGD